jgi:Domain of unknown function (DUF5666)
MARDPPHRAANAFVREISMTLFRIALAVSLALSVAPALAQKPQIATARATIRTISADGATLSVRTRAGEDQTVRLTPKTRFILVVPASLADVKPGDFVGVAALPGEGGELKAMEVHIFPESMRGTGEGYRPFDLAPKSSMTNGDISARVDAATGPKLTVTYKGGEQTIVVDPKTPIVALEPASRADLKPGANIIARGPKQGDGSIDAAFVLVGKDGLTPPM